MSAAFRVAMPRLSSLLGLRPGEARRVALFAALIGLLHMGQAIGVSAADSLFLTRVGAEGLPVVYLLTPVMMAAYVPAMGAVIRRFGIDAAFRLTLAIIVAGGVAFWALLSFSSATPVVYAVKLYALLWVIAVYTLFWNFIDDYFDLSDAKRLFALVAGGGAVGSMAGGAAVAVLAGWLTVPQLFLVWAGVGALTMPVLGLLLRRLAKLPPAEADAEPDDQAAGWRETVRAAAATPYAGLLMALSFLSLVALTLNDYLYLGVLARQGGEAAIAQLVGQLYVVANLLNLVMTFFVFGRLVAWLGVPTVAVLQPMIYGVGFVWLTISQGLPAGVYAFMAVNVFQSSVDYNNQNFLFNAIPGRMRKQLRTLIEGLGEPLSTATVGLFLLVAGGMLGPRSVAGIAVGVAVVYLAIALAVRAAYGPSMAANLRHGWLDFARGADGVLAGRSSEELARLAQAVRGGDLGLAADAVRVLWLNDRLAAIDALLAVLKEASEAQREHLRPLFATMLDADDPAVTRRVCLWLREVDVGASPALVEALAPTGLLTAEALPPMPAAPDPRARSASAVALWHSASLADNVAGLAALSRQLEGPSEDRFAALRALSRGGREAHAHALAPHLGSQDPAVRREALAAVARLVTPMSVALVPALVAATERPGEERLGALAALAAIRDPGCVGPLLARAGGFGPYERRQAVRLMAAIGEAAVPALAATFADPAAPYPARSIAAWALVRLAPNEVAARAEGVLDRQLDRAEADAALAERLEATLGAEAIGDPGLLVLAASTREQARRALDFALEASAAAGQVPAFELLSASLRSANAKTRADALETLEQGLPRAAFRRLAGLVSPEPVAAEPLNAQERRALLSTALRSPEPLRAAAAAVALGDEAPEALRQALLARPAPEVATALLAGIARRSEETAIARLAHLLRAPFFARFGCEALAGPAAAATIRDLEAGTLVYEEGAPADAVFTVLTGRVVYKPGLYELAGPAGTGRLRRGVQRQGETGPGETLGADGLFGHARYVGEAVAEGATRVLVVPTAALQAAAAAYPSAAIGLLETKLGTEARDEEA